MSASVSPGAPRGVPPNDTLSIIIGKGSRTSAAVNLTGWTTGRISRGLDRVPSDFEVEFTEKFPTQASEVVVQPGDVCRVLIGTDTIITGYVDRWMAGFSPKSHSVRIVGRSKCEDMVDSSITPDVLNGMSITTSSALDLANRLGAPYGVTASSLTGDNVPVSLPGGGPLSFQAVLTETPYEVLERVTRFAGVLLYDGTDGNLILANVGTTTMASGVAQGVNVEQASFTNGMDERYSSYLPCLMSTNFFGTQGIGGTVFQPATDAGVTRFRQLIVVSEQFQFGVSFAEKRAQWEAARRYGRSQIVRVRCDSWRDSAGKLWQPNAYISINLPALKLTPSAPWIIGRVDFLRDADGTHADLTLMPKQAFQPEPSILVPQLWNPDTGLPRGAAKPPPGRI